MRTAQRRAAALTILLALVPAAAHATATHAPVPVPVEATPIAFDEADPGKTAAGRLVWRGGLHLTSPDDAFGGISGLHVSPDGARFVAVTDTGHWLEGALVHTNGRLTGVAGVTRRPLVDPDGKSVAGSKRLGDAEALAVTPGDAAYVAFERTHRIWRYDDGPASAAATPVPMPPALDDAVNNKGLEALARLTDGTLLAFTEATLTQDGRTLGWRGTGAGAPAVALERISPFDLTDMAVLPWGDVLTLERRFSPLGGVGAQMRLIPGALAAGGTVLDGEIVYRSAPGETVDNMEGLAVREGPDGAALLYVVSDDNFNLVQRTLLLMFELRTARPAGTEP